MNPGRRLLAGAAEWIGAVAGKLDADHGATLSAALLMTDGDVVVTARVRSGVVELHAELDDGTARIPLHRVRATSNPIPEFLL